MKIASRYFAFVTSLLLYSLGMPLAADEVFRRIEVSPMLGYVAGGNFKDRFSEQKLNLEDSSTLGLQLNVRIDRQSTWEIQYAHQETRATTPGFPPIDVDIKKLEFGGTYEMNSKPTRPYAAATIGVSHFDPQSGNFNDDHYFSFSLGGGIKFFTDRQLGVTVDARWVAAVVDEDTDIFCVSAGGLSCLIQADAALTSQFRVFVGLNMRF